MELSFDSERSPLAARMRPRNLDEFVGQEHILAPGRLLRRAIEADQVSSLVLSGPPGTGKTTLARVIAEHTRSQFLSVNAVLSGVKELRAAIEQARTYRTQYNRRTILFVDEVHRWNRSQQDALLPWVEEGLLILVGATTENPFFEVNRALLSRSRVFLLTALQPEHLERVLDQALEDRARGYGRYRVTVTEEARRHLIQSSSGDARTLLNALELAVETGGDSFPPPEDEVITVDLAVAEDSIQQRAVLYDKDGDYHFDSASALIKSIRGSDPDASLYWLARMITAGEDPHYIFRRLLIQASEDVGLADPHAVGVVSACASAFDRVGLPEGQFHLSQAVLYLANTLKSNSTLAYFDALKQVGSADADEVPNHLKDASRDGADLGHGKGYQYPHAYRDHWVAQQYMPGNLQGRHFYQPGSLGWEGEQATRLEERRRLQLAAVEEEAHGQWAVAARRGGELGWTHRAEGHLYHHVRDLRDLLLSKMSISPTDRVLLAGDAVLLTVWETVRRTHAGLTAVWTDDRTLATLRYTLADREGALEAPQLATRAFPPVPQEPTTGHGGAPSGAIHPGPFDRILFRSYAPAPPDRIVQSMESFLTPDGIGLVADIEPSAGTRPSTILDLDDADRAILQAGEDAVAQKRLPLWRNIADEVPSVGGGPSADEVPSVGGGPSAQGAPRHAIDVQEHRFATDRSVTADQLTGWLAPETALGAELMRRAEADTRARITEACRRWTPRTVSWERTYLFVTFAPQTA